MASEACKKGHIRVNDLPAKASREVYPTDKIVVRKDQINHELTILDLPESRVAAKLVDIYRKNTTPAEALVHRELLKQAQEHYRKSGTGRPTKKDRRDIEDFASPEEEEG
jgi:ribosome-associated heat shock protein Hsp15